ncbi:hypothetical protein SDC9_147507 [bioreactor metagenome]|uniref:Uncharacterized protein n=1 Tax=bioreactor metagenome TaxID=1076179 RepID=A0A645EI97_9ZZZZ
MLIGQLPVSLGSSFVCQLPEVFVGVRKTMRNGEVWHDWFGLNIIDLHLVGNLNRVFEYFGKVGKYTGHLLLTFEVFLLGVP